MGIRLWQHSLHDMQQLLFMATHKPQAVWG